jgi:hypothetical protein
MDGLLEGDFDFEANPVEADDLLGGVARSVERKAYVPCAGE